MLVQPMTQLGPQSEWVVPGSHLFIIDSLVGFTWTPSAPFETEGALWWNHSLLPSSTVDRTIVPGSVYDAGDMTGDGIDDLIAWSGSTEEPESIAILPGPVDQFTQPVLESPDALPAPDFPLHLFDFAEAIIPHCGDLNDDGLEDLCSTFEVHLTPFDGTPDWTRPFDPNDYGLAADLDGDGVNELYIVDQFDVERVTFAASPAAGLFEGLSHYYWVLDLDEDGTDSLYTHGFGGVRQITNADFLAGTVQDTVFNGELPRTMREGDFDGDGVLEVYMGFSSKVLLAESDGTVVLEIVADSNALTGYPTGVAVGDADDNGIDDLLIGGGYETFYVPNPLDCLP